MQTGNARAGGGDRGEQRRARARGRAAARRAGWRHEQGDRQHDPGAKASPIASATPEAHPEPDRAARATRRAKPDRAGPRRAAGRASPTRSADPALGERPERERATARTRPAATTAARATRSVAANERYIAIPAERRQRGEQHLLGEIAVLPNETQEAAPSAASAGLAGCDAAEDRACGRRKRAREKNLRDRAGNAASAPPVERLGADEVPDGERAEHDGERPTRAGPGARRDADGAAGQRATELLVLELLEALFEELLRALEPPRQPERRRHEPADGAVADRAYRLRSDAPAHGAGKMDEVPSPRREQVIGILEPSRHAQGRPAGRPRAPRRRAAARAG